MELGIVDGFVDLIKNPSSLFLDLEMILFSLTLRLDHIIPWFSLKIFRSLDGDSTTMENLGLETIRIERFLRSLSFLKG